MALMNAGVPIRNMVSGVAMGLLMNDAGDTRILTDICGIEDAFGLMDFKVAGTESGITALQMDIKYKGGLSRSIFDNALAQANRGRMQILNEMKAVMSEPREELSDLVPRIVSFKVPQDRIGSIIGPSGKIIREIIEATATTIDIDDDGLVKIFGHPGPLFDKAIAWVKVLGGNLNSGDHFEGRVTRTEDYGVFVEIAPNQVGLVHISTIPRSEQDAFKKKYEKDDTVSVEVLDYDASTNRIRLKIIE
jgi:polyribonucleotide nucleotidyltransferase